MEELNYHFQSNAKLSRKTSEIEPKIHEFQRHASIAAESVRLLKEKISTDSEGHIFKRGISLAEKAEDFQEKIILNASSSNDLVNMRGSFLFLNQNFNSRNSISETKWKMNSGKELDVNEYEEKRTFGAMNWNNYFIYFKAGGGVLGTFILILLFLSSQAAVVLADYWVTTW